MTPMLLPPHFFLFQGAFALQLAAVGLFLAYAATPRRGLSLAATACLGGSLALHAVFTLLIAVHAGRLPLASGFEALSGWGLVLTALVVWVEGRHQLGLLGAFLAPLSAVTLLMGFRFAVSASVPVPGLDDGWLLAHVALAMSSYACFTAATGTAGAYLVQDRQLKAKRLGTLFYELPPLEELERLLARLTGAGLLLLLAAMAAGLVWNLRLYGRWGLDDPKAVLNLIVAGLYAAGLGLRWRGPLRGRRYAWLCVLAFLGLFFGYYLVNLYWGGHEFLHSAAGA